MNAAILAGGAGTRLRSVIADRPKVLAPVAGRPFLSRLLDQLVSANITTIVVCTGHLGDQVERAFGDRYRGARLAYSREPTALGTGGALRHALRFLTSEPVLVLNGDSYCEVDIDAFARFHADRRAAASIVLAFVADTSRYGRVRQRDDGAISGFDEKSPPVEPGWINAGCYLVTQRVLEAIPPGAVTSLERETFPSLAGDGLFGFRTTGRFIDIGTPASYAAAETFFAPATAQRPRGGVASDA